MKVMHRFAKNYRLGWLPWLCPYQAFNNKMNKLLGVFPLLVRPLAV
jgi:hypothetical protein